jgi:DNA-binding LacI/PurR family transcriptional regulator
VSANNRTSDDIGTRKVRLADVAERASVSLQTVSRVVNGDPKVSAQTRERVEAIIRDLNYEPNSAARTLATGRSRTLGVVCTDTTHYGPASMLLGLEQAARAAGYSINATSLMEITRRSVMEAIASLVGQGVDGVVVIAPHVSASTALSNLPKGTPLVALEGGHAADVPAVTVDQVGGAVQATRHLLELGHATVWHIAGPPDWLDGQGRVEGWRSALLAAQAPIPPMITGDWSARSGYDAGLSLATQPEVTAVFAANDQMALGALRAFHEFGRRVPGDISVVGFDDIPESAYFTPPLTTIRQDFDEVGRRGLDLLLQEMGVLESGPRDQTVAPLLVVRASSASPSGPARLR